MLEANCKAGLCTFGDAGLKSKTTYTYRVQAVDNAGNLSPKSSSVNNTTFQAKSGDINTDNRIDIFDLSVLAANWGSTNATPEQGDLNGDGKVDIFDLSILASEWGS